MHWSFVWIGYVLTWATIPHILTRNKPPASTLAWIWAVILFPYFGALFYFIFGTDRLVRKKLRAARQRRAAGAREDGGVTPPPGGLPEGLRAEELAAAETLP